MREPKDIIHNGKTLAEWINETENANLRGANLWDANLEGANLEGANLMGANLLGANLEGANLEGANLEGANLMGADLEGANLWGANLMGANLEGANLWGANLEGANLRGANLWGANLLGADLRGANLLGADLWGADLRGADLLGAKMEEIVFASTSILPDSGSFVGWKKCNYGVIVKLLIPAGAKRSNSTGRKCRAEYVRVLDVIGGDEGVTDSYGPKTVYRKGEIVKSHEWNENRWVECSGGIHFFITRIEAEKWMG